MDTRQKARRGHHVRARAAARCPRGVRVHPRPRARRAIRGGPRGAAASPAPGCGRGARDAARRRPRRPRRRSGRPPLRVRHRPGRGCGARRGRPGRDAFLGVSALGDEAHQRVPAGLLERPVSEDRHPVLPRKRDDHGRGRSGDQAGVELLLGQLHELCHRQPPYVWWCSSFVRRTPPRASRAVPAAAASCRWAGLRTPSGLGSWHSGDRPAGGSVG